LPSPPYISFGALRGRERRHCFHGEAETYETSEEEEPETGIITSAFNFSDNMTFKQKIWEARFMGILDKIEIDNHLDRGNYES